MISNFLNRNENFLKIWGISNYRKRFNPCVEHSRNLLRLTLFVDGANYALGVFGAWCLEFPNRLKCGNSEIILGNVLLVEMGTRRRAFQHNST